MIWLTASDHRMHHANTGHTDTAAVDSMINALQIWTILDSTLIHPLLTPRTPMQLL